MTKQLKTIAGVVVSMMVAFVAVDTEARTPLVKQIKDGTPFSVSGTMIGSLEGSFRVGSQRVFVSANTPIYVVGDGYKEAGYIVRNAHVYVGGVVKRGLRRAAFVVVRVGSVRRNGPSGNEAKFITPTGSNPNAGTFSEDVPE